MLFADIQGNQDTKSKLLKAVKNNKIAHAQLFTATDGAPGLSMALAYSTYILCEHKTEKDACGTCASCHKMSKYIHPDMHFVFPVSANGKIKNSKDLVSKSFLPYWRTFLLENPYGDLESWIKSYGGEDKQVNISKEESRQILSDLSLKSFEGKHKIMLLWLPEYLHITAANAILKVLEEPPEDTLFLLVTEDYHKLMPTIISRLQMVHINKFTPIELKNTLVEQYQFGEAEAEKSSLIAQGRVSKALDYGQEEGQDGAEWFRQWMRFCFRKDVKALVVQADNFHKLDKLKQKAILHYGLSVLRECLVAAHSDYSLNTLPEEEKKFVLNFSKIMKQDKIEKASSLLSDMLYYLERNANSRIQLLDVSLAYISLFQK